jgi:hypothetical protein
MENTNIPGFDLCPGHSQVIIAVLPLTLDIFLTCRSPTTRWLVRTFKEPVQETYEK